MTPPGSSTPNETAIRGPTNEVLLSRARPNCRITGAQIREARRLLALGPEALARRAKVPLTVVQRAERVDGEPAITIAHARALRHTLEAACVEFTNGDRPSVRLRPAG